MTCGARLGAFALVEGGCDARELSHAVRFADGQERLACAPHAALYERIGASIGRPALVVRGGLGDLGPPPLPEPRALLLPPSSATNGASLAAAPLSPPPGPAARKKKLTPPAGRRR